MNEQFFLDRAIEEIQQQNFGVTRQFLEVHEVAYDDAASLIVEKQDDAVIVYFPVKGQAFYFAVYFDAAAPFEIRATHTEPSHGVCFQASSTDLSFEQLEAMTTLEYVTGWNKGAPRRSGKAYHSISALRVELHRRPGELESRLHALLDHLAGDEGGIRKLAAVAQTRLQVNTVFHNGNTMLGGFSFSQSLLGKLNALGIEIDFDLYATGHFFKEDTTA